MRKLVWASALAALSALVACGGDSGTEGSTAAEEEPPDPLTVVLEDIAFKPEKITVKSGDTVTWRFEDKGIPHNVVADDKSFKSDTTDSGTFEHTFEKPGTFRYICTVHPDMTGSVKVT